jgi:hypothetical protein
MLHEFPQTGNAEAFHIALSKFNAIILPGQRSHETLNWQKKDNFSYSRKVRSISGIADSEFLGDNPMGGVKKNLPISC